MKPLKDEAKDQAAHAFIGFVVAYITSIVGPDITLIQGAYVGLILGLVREVTEGGGFGTSGMRDLLFWTIGGGIGGAL